MRIRAGEIGKRLALSDAFAIDQNETLPRPLIGKRDTISDQLIEMVSSLSLLKLEASAFRRFEVGLKLFGSRHEGTSAFSTFGSFIVPSHVSCSTAASSATSRLTALSSKLSSIMAISSRVRP